MSPNAYWKRAIDAYRNRRIFSVNKCLAMSGDLARRGWVEKLAPEAYPELQAMSEESLLEHARCGNKYETVLLSKMVKAMISQKDPYYLDDARIKMPTPTATEIVENQSSFMDQSTKVLHSFAKFKMNEQDISDYARLAAQYLDQIEALRPDYRWDGCGNVWILKPGYLGRAVGIVIRNSLDEILEWTYENRDRKYIAQKYVERPCLIYGTKFDIRQLMLVTISDTQVTIWMYKDCYIRFGSQEFTMDDLCESIHLTNCSVVKRYKNNLSKDPRLPKNRMWTLDQLKCHLRKVGAPDDTWDKIYNSFKQSLIAVVLATLDQTELTPNSFELYGGDFMLDENYNPILIEMNATPGLAQTHEVAERFCPIAVRDCLRVVLDIPSNPLADTGLFERVLQVNYNVNKELKGTIKASTNNTNSGGKCHLS